MVPKPSPGLTPWATDCRPSGAKTLFTLSIVLLAGFFLGKSAIGAPTPSKKAVEPIDRQPYRIRALIAIDPEARFDASRRDELVSDWKDLIQRFVGAPWKVEVDGTDAAAQLAGGLETLKAEALESASKAVEKVWLIRIGAEGSGLALAGREFDVTTGRLGGLQRRGVPVALDLPRELLRFALELFSPYAVIGERFGKDVALTVRGASLTPASPIGRVVQVGATFQPLRIVPSKKEGGKPVVRAIGYTFLRVEAATGAGARCSVVSVYSNPLTTQVMQENSLAALGVKPGKIPTRLRFVTQPDSAPAAGYVLTVRRHPDGQPHEIGTTDREGRITLDPLVADGLLVLRLLAGSSEPMVEFPLMPGHDETERTVPPFDPKPLAVTLETRLDSLRDQVIDLVAVRARLEARLKARFDGEDWPAAEAVLQEYSSLRTGKSVLDELNHLKEDAAEQQAKLRKPILTKTAQAQATDLETLIVRYLDDEVFKAYAEALAKMKSGGPGAVKKKEAEKKKAPPPPRVVEPEPEPAPKPKAEERKAVPRPPGSIPF